MDDMKKLVEKYKRELMEYSRAAKPEKLSFPEMLPEEPAPPAGSPEEPRSVEAMTVLPSSPGPDTGEPEQISAGEAPPFSYSPENGSERRKPRVVGYSDDGDALNSLEKYLSGLDSQSSVQTVPDFPDVPDVPDDPDDMPDYFDAESPSAGAAAPEVTGISEGQPVEQVQPVQPASPSPGDSNAPTAPTAPAAPSSPDMTGTENPVNTANGPSFNELPPQFTDQAPQNDFTGDAVSPETNFDTDITEPEQPNPFPRSGEITAAAPGQEENIGNIPESGQSPGEQLGRRSFESQTPAVNSRDDIKELVTEKNDNYPPFPPEPEYASMEEFLKANTRLGSLSFRTYTARNALPVPGANITVFKKIGGARNTFFDLTTDRSGQTQEVMLPAPPSSLSQSPTSGVQPYSLYDAEITAEGYNPISIRNLPVFEGILSVQRAAMIPSTGMPSPGETITEEEPDLTEVSDA